MATPTHPAKQPLHLTTYFLSLVTPEGPLLLRSPSSPSRKITQQIQVTKTKRLGPQYHFLHRLLERQNVKSLEVFQEQGFSFFCKSHLTNTDRVSLAYLKGML